MLLGTPADPLLGGRTALAPLPVRQGDPAGHVQLAPERGRPLRQLEALLGQEPAHGGAGDRRVEVEVLAVDPPDVLAPGLPRFGLDAAREDRLLPEAEQRRVARRGLQRASARLAC